MVLRIAVYGKGGIGKSTVASNLSYALAGHGSKVLHIGCDPKADSTRALLGGRIQTTVTEYMREVPPSKRRMEDIVAKGSNGVLCVEAGGPKPGVGCAGKGIVGTFQTLDRMGFDSLDVDFTLYDVLGDVVCGGFAVPMRAENSDALLIITSGEYMSLFAANNIMKGSLSFKGPNGRIAGIVLNRRNVDREDEMVGEFSRATGVPIICRINRSDRFREAESKGVTLSESFPGSEEAMAFSDLAGVLASLSSEDCVTPHPLTDRQMDTLYSTGRCQGLGEYRDSDPGNVGMLQEPVIMGYQPPRRIGKGPVSAVLMGGKVADIPVVVHGTDSCGYTMLCEVSNERISHLVSDPSAYTGTGDNIVCTGMTPDSAVFGGSDRLRSILESLAVNNKVILVISTCLPGMIGDDCESVIREVSEKRPGTSILYVDANRVDSGFDAHIEVMRVLSELIDPSLEPTGHHVNIVDDTFMIFNKGRNREYVSGLLEFMGLTMGPGFLNDCSIEDVIAMHRYGPCSLAEDRRDNRIIRDMLSAKGIQFTENPLPRGLRETLDWIRELSVLYPRMFDADAVSARVRGEFASVVSRYASLEGKRVAVSVWDPKDAVWMAEDLSACGCHVTVHSLRGATVPQGIAVSLHDSPKSMSAKIPSEGYDIIVDCIGLGKISGSVGGPESVFTHQASCELIRTVWGNLESGHQEGWRKWGE